MGNIERMRSHVEGLGSSLRPHLKTCKSPDVARRITGGSAPVCVSTLREAQQFSGAGFRDLLYAVGITPHKLEEVAELMARGGRVGVLLDAAPTAQAVATRGRELEATFECWIELDTDGHRSGVAPDAPELLEIATALHASEGTMLAGVLTHAGESYECGSVGAIRALAEQERHLSVAAAERIRAAGIPCPGVSVGSTPTATFAESFEGVSEVRAGVYVFQDLFQAGLGVCSLDDIALSVLTSVIGWQRDKNWLLTDSGWMALSGDRSTQEQTVDQGYGLVCGLDGTPLAGDLIVQGANQEHGIVTSRTGQPIDFDAFPVGRRLRVLPNHACATAAQFDRYLVLQGNRVVAEWPRFGGW